MTHNEPREEIWGGLLPKKETQSFDFIQNHPEWDGRGIVVGILDTGVDPGAIGLQQTSDGKPKVIDIVDCTGSGDVVMHGPFRPDADGLLAGLGGRKLKINPEWNNPSGEYRVGLKRLYELYPKSLKERITQHRKKFWDREQEQAEMLLQRAGGTAEMPEEELTTRLTLLRSMAAESTDAGPIIDCIVFHDGERWQAVVDCCDSGDLSSVVPMTDFRHLRQFRRFSDEDAFNFGVNIFDNGTVLSIVTDTGAHGTHVAGIVSAFHSDQPECNGVAPGAQIISLKIGNTRLGSMETGVGLMRALIEAVKRGCHIINMSYGEACAWDNEGIFVKLAEELVHKHGITFVSSAGNNGPCLSTVGAPGGTSSALISVGAFVTQSLMRSAYSMLGTVPETNFTWSSVGPATDGDMGVTVLAPGGAITCVPNWTLNKTQLMNGTSMSSPNACGCMALLLSAARQRFTEDPQRTLSPARLRTAIENSARLQNFDKVDRLGQHYGLLQVEDAWTHIESNIADSTIDIPLKVTVNSQRFKRGIYLRQPSEMKAAETFQVTISPLFHEDELADTKINYEMRVHVRSTAEWVKCPDYLLLAQAGKMMRITVDPTKLRSGQHYVEFVRGYDESNPSKGPVFEVPITVVVPEEIPPFSQQHRLGVLTMPITERVRKFLVPPPGCTFINVHIVDQRLSDEAEHPEDVTCSGSDDETGVDASSQMIVLHALQLLPGQPYRDNEKETYLSLTPGSTHCVCFPVTAGVTMELVLTRFWSTIGDVSCDVTLHFKGVTPSTTTLSMTSGEQTSSILTLSADLCTVVASPAGKLDKWLTTVMPNSAGKVAPLGERDVFPSGTPLYQMILEYSFDQPHNTAVTPRWKLLNGLLYESPFHSQFYMIYNSRKVLVACGDAFPESCKLDKGTYTVRLQIRHESPTVLESMNELAMVLERGLDSTVKLTCHKSLADASLGVNMSDMPIYRGTCQSLFWKGPSKLPKYVNVGSVLTGSVTYLKKSANGSGSDTRPGGFPVRYVVTTSSIAAAAKNTVAAPTGTSCGSESAPAPPSTAQKFAEAIRDAKVKFVENLAGSKESFDAIFDEAVAEYPDCVRLRLARLTHLIKCGEKMDDAEPKTGDVKCSRLDAIVACASAIVGMLNEKAIAEELGCNVDKANVVAMKTRKDVESDRDSLVTALAAKCRALADKTSLFRAAAAGGCGASASAYCAGSDEENKTGAESEGTSSSSAQLEELQAAFAQTYCHLQKWDNTPSSDKHWPLYVTKMCHEKRFGAALKRVNEMIGKKNQGIALPELKSLLKEQSELLVELGWTHIRRHLEIEQKLTSVEEYLPF